MELKNNVGINSRIQLERDIIVQNNTVKRYNIKEKVIDFIKVTNIKYALLNVTFGIYLIALAKNFYYSFSSELNQDFEFWFLSEFLINYQDGFVRRGLIGEMLFFLVNTFDINLELTIKLFCISCIVIVFTFFVYWFLKKKYSLYILPLCFFLGGNLIANPIRKDYLFICFFILITWICSQKKINSWIKISAINILGIVIILSHEVFGFFSIPLLFLLFIADNRSLKYDYFKSTMLSFLYLLPIIVSFFATIFFHGDNDTAHVIWQSWLPHLGQETTQIGHSVSAISWPVNYAVNYHIKLNFLSHDQGISSFLVWMITFPVIYYIATNFLLVFRRNKKTFTTKDKTILSSILIFQLLCLLPVFVFLSCDYIRVIFYWITSSFCIFLLFPKATIQKIFPVYFINIVTGINNRLLSVLYPTRTTVVFLMLGIGISNYSFNMEDMYNQSMFFNVVKVLSKPFKVVVSYYG